jgi:hypothetical protein
MGAKQTGEVWREGKIRNQTLARSSDPAAVRHKPAFAQIRFRPGYVATSYGEWTVPVWPT